MVNVPKSIVFLIIIKFYRKKQSMMYNNTNVLTTGMMIVRYLLGHVILSPVYSGVFRVYMFALSTF